MYRRVFRMASSEDCVYVGRGENHKARQARASVKRRYYRRLVRTWMEKSEIVSKLTPDLSRCIWRRWAGRHRGHDRGRRAGVGFALSNINMIIACGEGI